MNRLVRFLITSAALAAIAWPTDAQQPRSVFVEDVTWPELRAAIAGGATTLLVVSGSVEQSGPHVALGKHNFRARTYAERIARELGNALVAPIVPAAPTSESLMRFPGTINVRQEVFAEYNAEIARSLAAAGFKHVVLPFGPRSLR